MGVVLPAGVLAAQPASAPLPGPARRAIAPAVAVTSGWVRATVAGQQSSGAYMTFTSLAATTLVDVSTPAAGIAEIHEMKMDGDIMRMRQLLSVNLPAGQPVRFKPGGNHVMLMDLKQPFRRGSTVPFVLTFRDAAGVQTRLDVLLPVEFKEPVQGRP